MDKQAILEEFKIWRKNVCFMYDYVLSVTTSWPTLTCDYYPADS